MVCRDVHHLLCVGHNAVDVDVRVLAVLEPLVLCLCAETVASLTDLCLNGRHDALLVLAKTLSLLPTRALHQPLGHVRDLHRGASVAGRGGASVHPCGRAAERGGFVLVFLAPSLGVLLVLLAAVLVLLLLPVLAIVVLLLLPVLAAVQKSST